MARDSVNRRKFVKKTGLAVSLAAGLAGQKADAPAAAKEGKTKTKGADMNLIVIMLDSMRPDKLGCYGSPRVKTPSMDSLAAEGILFQHVIAEQPITVPARNAYSMGMCTFPWYGWEPLPDKYPLLQDIMREAGFATAIIGDMGPPFTPKYEFCTRFQHSDKITPAVDKEAEKLFSWDLYNEDYTDPKERAGYLGGHVKRSGPGKDGGEKAVTRACLDWLKEKKDEKFFLWADYLCPHEPWDPPARHYKQYDRGYKGKKISLPDGKNKRDWTREELEHIEDLYDGDISTIDEYVGKFIAGIAELGLADNTIVCVISDHGEPLGERNNVVRKFANILNREQVEVVQIMRIPGAAKGRKVEALVQNYDLTPTLLSLLGIEAPETMDGIDLQGLISGKQNSVREHTFSGWKGRASQGYPMSVRSGKWAYIRNRKDGNALYDVEKDPWEEDNLIDKKPAVVKRLDAVLTDYYEELKGRRDGLDV